MSVIVFIVDVVSNSDLESSALDLIPSPSSMLGVAA